MKSAHPVFICLVFATIATAQPQKGSFEIGLSGSGGIFKEKTKYSYNTNPAAWSTTKDSETSTNYLMFFLRPAYYVSKSASIEPEIMVYATPGQTPAIEASANLLYHFSLENDKTVPFVLAGFGAGNAVVFNNMALYKATGLWNVSVFNLGAGLKTYLGKHIALRTEYRYQNRDWEGKIMVAHDGIREQIGATQESRISHIILFGFSYLF